MPHYRFVDIKVCYLDFFGSK